MPVEIEHKFLVRGDFKPFVVRQHEIKQGFLSTVPERTVRVRIADDKAFITVKGLSNKAGTHRMEWEQEINYEDAETLFTLCEPFPISKTRYIVPVSDGLFFEVDEFHAHNKGLVIAEIELPDADTPFDKPDWLGEEVTGDVRYYNSNLARKPFTSFDV